MSKLTAGSGWEQRARARWDGAKHNAVALRRALYGQGFPARPAASVAMSAAGARNRVGADNNRHTTPTAPDMGRRPHHRHRHGRCSGGSRNRLMNVRLANVRFWIGSASPARPFSSCRQ